MVRTNFTRAISFAVCVFLIYCRASAVSLTLSDFDGTLMEGRKSANGAFSTKIVLLPIRTRENTLINSVGAEDPIEISSQDFHRIKKFLGTENMHGSQGGRFTLEDGQVIQPGQYYFKYWESFDYFLESRDKTRNYVLEDFKAAEERAKEGRVVKGPFWELAETILSNPETARTFGLLTMRGHSRDEWREFFEYVQKQPGYNLENLPNFNYFHSISTKAYEKYDTKWRGDRIKKGILNDIASQLGRINLKPSDEKISPDGRSRGQFHTLVFAEDSQEIVDAAAELFQGLAQRRLYPIKYILINTGTRSEVAASGRPQFAVVKPDGTFRRAAPIEVIGEPTTLSTTQKKWLSTKACVETLSI